MAVDDSIFGMTAIFLLPVRALAPIPDIICSTGGHTFCRGRPRLHVAGQRVVGVLKVARGRPRQLAPNVGLPKKEGQGRLSRKLEQQKVRELYDNSLSKQRTIEVPVDSQYRQKYIVQLLKIVVMTKLRRKFRR